MSFVRANREYDCFHSVDCIDLKVNFFRGEFFLKEIKSVNFFDHCYKLKPNKGKCKRSVEKIVFEFGISNKLTCKK